MILVTTAGKVGSEAVRLLRERDVPVRVLVRDPAKVTTLADAGAEVAEGDLDVRASIDDAMAGVSAVVLVSPAVPAQELNVVAQRGPGRRGPCRQGDQQGLGGLADRAAALAGRDRGGAGCLRNPAHAAAVERLHAERAGAGPGDRRRRAASGPAAGEGRSGLVDARDVAAAAAEIAAAPAGHAGKTYWLTGPALISNYDVAAVLSKLLGRTITYRELTFEENKDAMIRAGVPAQIAEMNAQAFSLTADGDAEWVTDDVPSLLGRPARSFGQFAADYAAAFS